MEEKKRKKIQFDPLPGMEDKLKEQAKVEGLKPNTYARQLVHKALNEKNEESKK